MGHDHDDIDRAIKNHSANTGKWLSAINNTLAQGLAAIALAVSTPDDNSEEIKRLTNELKQSTDALDAAVKSQPL